jgi:hypothetical protein
VRLTRARPRAGACVFQGPTGVRWAEMRLPLLSKTGAVCSSAARKDLRGGRPAMTLPTATLFPFSAAQESGEAPAFRR